MKMSENFKYFKNFSLKAADKGHFVEAEEYESKKSNHYLGECKKMSLVIDRLTQENQQLREALAALVETSSMNEAQLSQELLEFHEDSEALTKAINLLSQLEAKDE